jgi:two-component system, cell cycle sensor histidine kinase and response regulator CckA
VVTRSSVVIADFEQLPIPVGVCELDGTIIGVNPAGGRLLARPHDQIVGRKAWDFAPGGEHIWQEILRIARERGEYRGDITIATPDEPRGVEYVVALRQYEGRNVAVFFALLHKPSVRDPETETTQRLEAIGLVAGGIAHEFNNQLTTVLAEATAARETSDLAETRESLRRIEAAANRMAQLTKQLLAYSGRGRFFPELIDPDQLLTSMRTQLESLVAPGVALDVRAAGPSVAIEIDRGLLLQIVSNLVANASEAHPGEGAIEVTTSTDGMGWWQMQVRDRGVGMDSITTARIWDPFFSTKTGHHGLGLSAVVGIVRRIGGEINVMSKPGDGSTFTLRLPIVPGVVAPAEPASEELPSRARSLAGMHALIADDEPAVRTTIRRLLERRNAIVTIAEDGVQADALLRQGPYSFIVLDVMMPGLTGFQLLATVRATNPQARVMLMSGYTDIAHISDEPDAFLEKPFTSQSFNDAIDQLLG